MKLITYSILTLLVVLFIINLIPFNLSNPPISSDIIAPENVKMILRESCYDCHSNETIWYWYTKYAPVSWLIAHDVNEGREYLNFSTWDNYSVNEKREILHESIEEIQEGEMPSRTSLSTRTAALARWEPRRMTWYGSAISSRERLLD